MFNVILSIGVLVIVAGVVWSLAVAVAFTLNGSTASLNENPM